MRVLVAEDEIIVRMWISLVLTDAGHEVVEAADGASAARLIKEQKCFDMIVTDYRMPGMNGIIVADMARQYRPNMPVLFLTGWVDLLLSQDVSHPYHYLSKPFTADQLMDAVQETLE